MAVRVSDYIAKFIASKGVESVFLLSGGGMMHLLDAISRQPGIRYVCHHHEQAAAMAAEAYARRSGRLGVCYATSGPGGPNTITGILGAWLDSTPMLVVTGQAKSTQTVHKTGLMGLRQFGAYEVDFVSMVAPITKYAVMLDDPITVRAELEKAYHLATTGRPGPVVVDVPIDIQGALIEPDDLVGYVRPEKAISRPDAAAIAAVLLRLTTARRPVLLLGHGVRCSGTVDRVRALAEALNVPVVTTQFATDLLPHTHRLLVGRVGTKGDRSGNLAIQTADVILFIGASLHAMTTGYEFQLFARDAYKIQVEPDSAVLARESVGVQEKIQAMIEDFVDIAEQVMAGSPVRFGAKDWIATCNRWKSSYPVSAEPHKVYEDRVNFYQFIDTLSDLAEVGDTIVSDSGNAWYLVTQAFRPKEGQRIILSGGLGTMGYALPATTGAAVAAKGGRVICITGDGSLQTVVHELATLRQHQLNAKLFIANNSGYASIRNTQNQYFGGNLVGTGPESGVFMPHIPNLAEAYELAYFRIGTVADLEPVIRKALATAGPALIDVLMPEIQDIMPSVTTVRHADGRLESKPLHDMYPFLTSEKLKEELSGGAG